MLLVMITGSSKRLNRPPSLDEKWEVLLLTLPDRRRARQVAEPPARGGVLDQLREPALPGLLPLGAQHPVARGAPVTGRLGREELPGFGAEPVAGQLGRLVALERVDAGSVLP